MSIIPESPGSTQLPREPSATPITSAPPRPERPKSAVFPIVMSIILVGLLITAWFSQGTAGTTSPAPTPGPEMAVELPQAPSSTESTPASAPADELKALKGEVGALIGQIDGLGKRIDALPGPMPAPDFAPMQAKLDDLTPLPGMVAPLSKKVEELDARVGTIDDALVALRKEVERRPEAATTPEPEAPAGSRDAVGAALGSGATLFKERKYPLALETFGKLQKSHPDDARVWYYSALANGLNTGKWDGTSAELVKEGLLREKAGIPDTAEIDAEFAGLTKATGKEWLAYFRKQVKP